MSVTCGPRPTARLKRRVFRNALGYAVELGRLGLNAVEKIQRDSRSVAETVAAVSLSHPRTPVRCWLSAARIVPTAIPAPCHPARHACTDGQCYATTSSV